MKLENKKSTLVLEGDRAVAFENRLTGESYPVTDGGAYAVFDGERIPIRVQWTAHDTYFEKRLTMSAPSDGVLEEVVVMDFAFPEATELHYHDDCTIWHCPMCTYARHEKGGVFFGLAYPYWEDERIMSFKPYLPMKEGEEFVSEAAFIGATVFTGKKILSNGPYPGRVPMEYYELLEPMRTGLNQHFKGFKVPDDVGIPVETQDSGEIRAMRDFFREYLGEWPLPDEGYYVWQNGWWAGLHTADKHIVDVMAKIGVKDVLTAAMYFGHADHPSCEPAYIRDVRFDPLRFPKIPDSEAVIHTLEDGHHHNAESVTVSSVDTAEEEYTSEFYAPPAYDDMIRYGKSIGVNVTSFSTPNNSYTHYPQWYSLDEKGEPYKYFSTKLSCPASKDFMEHHLEMLFAVLDKYEPRQYDFDGRWLGYREIGGVYDTIGEDPCYGENHGHLPGKSRYMEWKNIEELKRRIRERYPTMCFEQYYGLKRGSTWALTYYNSDENYYEVSGPDDTRYQTWHNENDRFRPTYMHFTNLMGRELEAFKYAMISAISTSAYTQIADGYHCLNENEECVGFFKKWRQWASDNIKYLKDRESLFGCPGSVPVDGSAHIIDGEGYVFLFNITNETQEPLLDLAEIDGLEGEYIPEMIYPVEKTMDVVGKKGTIKIPMEKRSAVIIKLSRK